jgi:hypothetical protein
MVPGGHAALTFFWLLASWWWVQPAEAGALNFSLDPAALKWIAKEAMYQCGVILVVTCLLLAALPRIHLRHAVYISLASAVAAYVVHSAAAYVSRPITTNGEHLMDIVLTFVVVLLIGGVVIRQSDSRGAQLNR